MTSEELIIEQARQLQRSRQNFDRLFFKFVVVCALLAMHMVCDLAR